MVHKQIGVNSTCYTVAVEDKDSQRLGGMSRRPTAAWQTRGSRQSPMLAGRGPGLSMPSESAKANAISIHFHFSSLHVAATDRSLTL